MKSSPRLTTIVGFFLMLTGAGDPLRAAEVLKIQIDPGKQYQPIDGFGASDAWQCQFVGRDWPVEKRERIAELLFSQQTDSEGNPRGIGLSIWRFNIGAGTAEQGDGSGIKNPWRRAECFQNPDGSYDWSKQAGQRWFLEAAHQRGVEKFLAFSNAPPVHLSRNGHGYADKGPPNLNIKAGKLDDYATFLTDVLEHFEKEKLPFDYLSPINEPQWGWDEADQEGTPAQNEEIHSLVRYLSYGLSSRGMKSQIVIGEAGTIGHAFMTMDFQGLTSDGRDDQAKFFFSPAMPFYIGGLPNVAPIISAHDYYSVWPLDKQVEYRQMLHQSLQAVNPALGYWQSEYSILEPPNAEIHGGGGRDLGMDTALYVARLIHQDLTIAHARSWQWWTAVSQVDFKDGLIYLDDGSEGDTGRMGSEISSLIHDGAVRESKLLWTLGNYSRFVRPGMVHIGCEIAPGQSFADGLLASAYKGTDGHLTAVLVNLSKEEKHCDFGQTGTADVFTTSSEASLRKSSQPASDVRLPARSVATVCLTGR